MPFAGGFTLASHRVLQPALLDADNPEVDNPRVPRPRSWWLLPLAVSGYLLSAVNEQRKAQGLEFDPCSGTSHGHSLLALVQEDSTPGGEHIEFQIRFFDSHRRLFNTHPIIGVMIEAAARRLGWSTHRVDNSPVRFKSSRYPIPRQLPGGWQCGLHVIINAWILAMGLQINPHVTYTEPIYKEGWRYARVAMAGLLDWRSLIAWFFCRRLTVERTYTAVNVDRRFGLSTPQEPTMADGEPDGDGDLDDRVLTMIMNDDQPLETLTEQQVPYDHSNNIDLLRPPPPAPVVNDKMKESKKDEALKKRYDDPGLDIRWTTSARTKRHQPLDNGLNDYDEAGDVRMTGTSQLRPQEQLSASFLSR
jgi:hypothetical protein